MDERKLLLLIKNHPEVYNPYHKNYRRLEARSAAWAEIAQEMNEDETYCKKRWKNIRAVVIRDFIDPKKRSDYYLREYLDFYLPFMKSSKLQEASSPSENVRNDANASNIDMETQDISPEVREIEESRETREAVRSRKPYSTKRKLPKYEVHEDASYFVQENDDHNTLHTSMPKNVSDQKINCDKAFLISIYDDFKGLDPRRKRVFKGRVMNLLNELHDAMTSAEDIKGRQSNKYAFTIECGNVKWSAEKT